MEDNQEPDNGQLEKAVNTSDLIEAKEKLRQFMNDNVRFYF
jgi:hypothetical protein